MHANASAFASDTASFAGAESCAVRKVTVHNPYGVHIQPAAEVAALVRKFRSTVRLVVHGKRLELRNMIDVLSAELRQGTEVVVLAEGADAEEAAAAVGRTLASVHAPIVPAVVEPWRSTVSASAGLDLKRVA